MDSFSVWLEAQFSDSDIAKAASLARYLAKNVYADQKNKWALAVVQASGDFGIPTKLISQKLSGAKGQILWRSPDLTEVAKKYPLTGSQAFLRTLGHDIKDSEGVVKILKGGKLRDFHRFTLNKISNIKLDSNGIEALKEEDSFRIAFNDVVRGLKENGKIKLAAPVVFENANELWILSGQLELAVAVDQGLPIRLHVVPVDDLRQKQSSLF